MCHSFPSLFFLYIIKPPSWNCTVLWAVVRELYVYEQCREMFILDVIFSLFFSKRKTSQEVILWQKLFKTCCSSYQETRVQNWERNAETLITPWFDTFQCYAGLKELAVPLPGRRKLSPIYLFWLHWFPWALVLGLCDTIWFSFISYLLSFLSFFYHILLFVLFFFF